MRRRRGSRLFVLQVVQPGLAGLMDGSVSTLAPLFAAAFATSGTVADVPGGHGGGARRGHQHGLRRGAVRRRHADRPRAAAGSAASSAALMTALGGLGHTLPYPDSAISGWRRALPGRWSWWSWWSSPGCATATWTRRWSARLPGGGRRPAGIRRRHSHRQFLINVVASLREAVLM